MQYLCFLHGPGPMAIADPPILETIRSERLYPLERPNQPVQRQPVLRLHSEGDVDLYAEI
jgi:hypothetical protein